MAGDVCAAESPDGIFQHCSLLQLSADTSERKHDHTDLIASAGMLHQLKPPQIEQACYSGHMWLGMGSKSWNLE